MAVLVIQFVITMMMATKAEHGGAPPLPVQVAAVFPRGLVRYLHPSDEELRVYVPTSQLDKKDKKKQRQQQAAGEEWGKWCKSEQRELQCSS